MTDFLQGKIAIITGASRGVGKAVALRFAELGINIAIGAKTVTSTEKTPGTIFETASQIEDKGVQAIAVQTDLRFEDQVKALVDQTVAKFGRIDIIVNNAGAIMFLPVAEMPVNRFDLLMQLNYRAPYILCHYAIPHLKKQKQGHIINMSPPQVGALAAEKWQGRTCYLMSKFGMSHLTMGLAEELKPYNISVNSLWPQNIIDTQATRVFAQMLQADSTKKWYSPELLADACAEIIKSEPSRFTGQTLIAEDLLQLKGIDDFEKYRVDAPV